MKILWLEDELETIEVISCEIRKFCQDITIKKSLSTFSDELEALKDHKDNKIIIDIRMIFNNEIEFTCFKNRYKIQEKLDAGFEYFNYCIKGNFPKSTIIFFSSKPELDAQLNAEKHLIDTDKIVSKDSTIKLLDILKDTK